MADSGNIPVDEMLKNLQKKLKSDISDINKELKDSVDVEKKCLEFKVLNFYWNFELFFLKKTRQKSISERLSNISKMQNIIADYTISLDSFLEKQSNLSNL